MANYLECPSCSTELQWWRKLSLGPARSVQCSSCSAEVSVSKAHAVALLLTGFFVFYLIGILVPRDPYLERFILFLVWGALILATYVLYVPLVVRSKPG